MYRRQIGREQGGACRQFAHPVRSEQHRALRRQTTLTPAGPRSMAMVRCPLRPRAIRGKTLDAVTGAAEEAKGPMGIRGPA